MKINQHHVGTGNYALSSRVHYVEDSLTAQRYVNQSHVKGQCRQASASDASRPARVRSQKSCDADLRCWS
jgi:hypothetical protein